MTLDLWTLPHLISTFNHGVTEICHVQCSYQIISESSPPCVSNKNKGLVNCLKMIPLEFPADSGNFEEEISGITSADYCNIV